MSARRPRCKGQSLVEFAFVIIAFLLLTMGIIDFGRAIFYYNMLSNAAREGAREGIISTRPADQLCAAALAQVLAPSVNSGAPCSTSGSPAVTNAGSLTIQVWVGTAPSANSAGTPDKVQLDYTFTPITPVISTIVGSSFNIEADSSMYVEP